MAQIQQYLDTIKTAESGESVRDAIVQALDKIHGDNPVTVTQRTAKMPQSGDLIINAEGGTAYDQVTVHPADGSKGAMTLTELEATENREYIPDDNEYYSKVTVNVPQLNNDIMEDVLEVTENNVTIYATEEGFDGFSAIHVNISNIPVSGQFEVEFYDTDKITLLDRQLVPAYGSADYHGPYLPTDPGGKTFVGWNPSPVGVTKNLKCYPNFVSQQMIPGEISDDWDVIVANGGANYPIGSYKSLSFSATFKNEEIEAFGFKTGTTTDKTISWNVIMFKVAEGEDGSRSTWISTPTTMSFNVNWVERWNVESYYTWPDRAERRWMQCMFTKFAPFMQQHIKPVVKYTQGSAALDPPYQILPTQDSLWMVALKEICIDTDYWHYDLSMYLKYDQEITYEKAKAKWYDGLPLCIPYMNQANLTPKQRDDFLKLNGSSQFTSMRIGYRDSGDHYLDRRIALLAQNDATKSYTNPTTGETEYATYSADIGATGYAAGGFSFGFCLI